MSGRGGSLSGTARETVVSPGTSGGRASSSANAAMPGKRSSGFFAIAQEDHRVERGSMPARHLDGGAAGSLITWAGPPRPTR